MWPKGPLSSNFETEWMKKKPRGTPSHIFRHYEIVQNSQFFFENFLKALKGHPFDF